MADLETDLDRIAALAAQNRDDNQAFGYFIDFMWDREGRADAELDALVDEIAAEVIPQIDCTRCANCCRTLPLGLTPGDISPLAAALNLPPDEVIARYVDRCSSAAHDAGSGEWGVMRGSPCPLLSDKLCSVYAHRPAACRNYPLLTPDFRWLYGDMIDGAGVCPITFNVLERLKVRLGW